MSPSNCELINDSPFGIDILGLPKCSKELMPKPVENGNLDGSTYFICLNDDILDALPVQLALPIRHDKECFLSASTRA
jgi:hypothetical protein